MKYKIFLLYVENVSFSIIYLILLFIIEERMVERDQGLLLSTILLF